MEETSFELGENVQGKKENKVRSSHKSKDKNEQKKRLVLGTLFPLGLVIIWEIVAQLGIIPSYQLPAPTALLAELWSLTASGEIWGHLFWTLYRVFTGFFIGTLAATVVSIIVGFSKTAEYLFDPIIQAFRSIPSMAWVPLFILWMGIGESSKITMIAVGVFFPVYLNLVNGIWNVDKKLLEVGEMYQLSFWEQVRYIVLPAALPSFAVGVRSGLGLGWMFVVAAELMGASEGLGFLLVQGQNTLAPETILVSIVLFAIIGKFSDWILKLIEGRLLRYKQLS